VVRYRKSKKVGPFRITLTQRGLSTSVGKGPLRISKGADGKVRRTVRIPGTGIYDTRVVSQAPRKAAGRKGQNLMQPSNYPPPQLPPAGWYADPTGEASLRYWDGHQWTSSTNSNTDVVPDALKKHNCPLVVGEKFGVAVGTLRGARMILAALRDEQDDSRDRILDEVEGCVLCLRFMAHFLASATSSVFMGFAGNNKALAVQQAEKQVREYVEAAQKQL
jgi:hypothetical protein